MGAAAEKVRALPLPTPLALSRAQAAAFIGISSTTFDRLVREGRMPRPKAIYGRNVWAVLALEQAFAALDAAATDHNPLDEVNSI